MGIVPTPSMANRHDVKDSLDHREIEGGTCVTAVERLSAASGHQTYRLPMTHLRPRRTPPPQSRGSRRRQRRLLAAVMAGAMLLSAAVAAVTLTLVHDISITGPLQITTDGTVTSGAAAHPQPGSVTFP